MLNMLNLFIGCLWTLEGSDFRLTCSTIFKTTICSADLLREFEAIYTPRTKTISLPSKFLWPRKNDKPAVHYFLSAFYTSLLYRARPLLRDFREATPVMYCTYTCPAVSNTSPLVLFFFFLLLFVYTREHAKSNSFKNSWKLLEYTNIAEISVCTGNVNEKNIYIYVCIHTPSTRQNEAFSGYYTRRRF